MQFPARHLNYTTPPLQMASAGFWGCTETFMHKNVDSQHRHIYASICAGRLICACGTSDRAAARQLARPEFRGQPASMILTRVQSTRPTAPGVKITLGPRNFHVRLSARPRARSGWRAQIARPASRRLPSALRRGKASPQRGNEENAPQRLVRRLRGCGGLQKRVRGRRFGVLDAARPRDEEAEPRRRRIAGCAAHEAPGGGRKRAVAGRRARRKAKAVPPNSTRVATRGIGRGRSRAEPFYCGGHG